MPKNEKQRRSFDLQVIPIVFEIVSSSRTFIIIHAKDNGINRIYDNVKIFAQIHTSDQYASQLTTFNLKLLAHCDNRFIPSICFS